ncbi:urea ABC transporter permease subunit UrtB [Lichenicola cladoniae]|uniref:Urea ABC transporter permease subunit UrtB n=1 Tax=Lichenicola cladoniae TaxID=1484109 RepID=A0A6M8H840_9PROT|nr:urea ABC transporter permease subunit UrtB [Lichenicola cladoniae]NPD65228.1 urea ABC transporter permease subunit UrtB [Acetobacteraceae bacterium]QKE88823.1 urea ABC transporter permease subunit UrtB [Lichenicola cladoniae]
MRSVSVLLAVLVLLVFATTARAQEDGYAGLASGRYASIADGATQLAASGDPHADTVLHALAEHRLLAGPPGGPLYIRAGDALTDARTGATVGAKPEGLRPVRLNNRVREALDAALAVLDLQSPDRGKRLHAVEAIYDTHPPALLPALDRALAHEPDAGIRRGLAEARAAMLLSAPVLPGPAEALGAVRILASRGGLPARAILARLQHDASPELHHAATEAIAAIDLRLRLWSILQDLFYGISLGSVLLLAAMGLAITFGVMGVINMAHGELIMIGAYVTYLAQQATGSPGVGLVLAIPLAFLVTGGLGVLIERGLIRFLYGRPLETLLATWGLSLVLQQAIRSLFGPTNISVTTPAWMSGSIAVGGLVITLNRLVIIVFAALVMLALTLVLKRTSLGLQMRAVTQNRRMASLMGIRTPRVDALTFGLGSGVAGLAGVAISQIDNVSPNLGQGYIIDSFMVVVFGGVGNLGGTLAGAATLGIANKVLEPVVGAVLAKIIVLLLLIAFIQRKPRGMFPLRGRGIES